MRSTAGRTSSRKTGLSDNGPAAYPYQKKPMYIINNESNRDEMMAEFNHNALFPERSESQSRRKEGLQQLPPRPQQAFLSPPSAALGSDGRIKTAPVSVLAADPLNRIAKLSHSPSPLSVPQFDGNNNNNNNNSSNSHNKRILTAPVGRPKSAFSGSSERSSLSGHLSTTGQAMYVEEDLLLPEDHRASEPLWKSIGVHEGEDYDGEESLHRDADDDVSWLMTTTNALPLSPSASPAPMEFVLQQIERDGRLAETERYLEGGAAREGREGTLLFSTMRSSDPDLFAQTVKDGFGATQRSQQALVINTEIDVEEDECIDENFRSRSRSRSPTSPKFYSWMGDRKKPATGSKRGSPVAKNASNNKRSNSPQRKPVLRDIPSAQQNARSQQQKKVKGLTKFAFDESSTHESPYLEHIRNPVAATELQRLHRDLYKKNYSKALPSPSPSASPLPSQQQQQQGVRSYAVMSASLSPAGLAERERASNASAFFSATGVGIARPASRQLAPISRSTPQLTTLGHSSSHSTMIAQDFLAISAKVKENKQRHVLRKEQLPEDLYVQTQLFKRQLSPSRGAARVMTAQGVVAAPQTLNGTLPDESDYTPVNTMLGTQTRPAAGRQRGERERERDAQRRTNDIDKLVSGQVPITSFANPHNAKKPTLFNKQAAAAAAAVPRPLSAGLHVQDVSDEEREGERAMDAIELLLNMHVDPLYRIIREEVERVSSEARVAQMADDALSLNSSFSAPDGLLASSPALAISASAQSLMPANNRLRMRTQPAQKNIVSSDVRVLSYFHSLPPAVWVTARLVYFLIIAYYETVIAPKEHEEYRRLLNLDPLWQILRRQSEEEEMHSMRVAKSFSWPCLQELMKHASLFVKLLDLIENGVLLENDNEWALFQQSLRRSLARQRDERDARAREDERERERVMQEKRRRQGLPPLTEREREENNAMQAHAHAEMDKTREKEIERDLPVLAVQDNASSRALFFEHVPLCAFSPLREMVKAARGFLLNTSSSLLYSSAAFGAPSVPGSPLAVSAALNAWCKRVIALLYVCGTERAKQLQAKDKEALVLAHAQSQSHSHTASHAQGAIAMEKPLSAMLPPCIAFSVILDTTSYFFVENNNALSFSTPSLSYDAYAFSPIPLFMHTALALVKPTDELEVLVSDKIEASIGQTRDMLRVKRDLEHCLSSASASPLHRVRLLDQDDTSENSAYLLDHHQILQQLHPILRHYFIHKDILSTSLQNTHTPQAAEQLELLIAELRVGGTKPMLPLIPAYSRDIVVGSAATGDVALPMTLADVIREQLNCSLALVSDSISAEQQAELAAGMNAGSRSFRYVVGVTDTQNSWNAFQLACRVAKETDTIVLVHIPTIDCHFSRPELIAPTTRLHRTERQQAMNFHKEKVIAPPRPSLSLEEYQRLYEDAVTRKSRVVNLYKSLGYNVHCGEIPSYVDVCSRMMENYSKTLRYCRKIERILNTSYHPMHSHQFFQYNEEMRANSRALLKAILSTQADYVILGADKYDIFNGLSHNFQEQHWKFVGKSATAMAREEALLSLPQSSPDSRRAAKSSSDKFAIPLSPIAAINEGKEDADEYFADEFEESSQVNAQEKGAVNRLHPTNAPSQDTDLDSFIVEDNEEGENSLRPGSNVLRPGHSFATVNDEAEDPREAMAHLQLYLQYAKYPANFADFLISDSIDNRLFDPTHPNSTNSLSLSFILANIPVSNRR